MSEHLREQWRAAAGATPEWRINGKPYHDGVWIEVEPEVWYRGADHSAKEIPSAMVVARQGDKWAWEARALTFIGAPHENRAGAKGAATGTAKTLEEAQAKAMAALAKDQEFFRRYQERMDAKMAMPSWRALSDGVTWWKDYDACIAPDVAGSRRTFEVFIHGQQVTRAHRLDEAKAYVERIHGPQRWRKVDLPKEVAVHYYFGPTEEFTDPTNLYVVDALATRATAAAHRVVPLKRTLDGYEFEYKREKRVVYNASRQIHMTPTYDFGHRGWYIRDPNRSQVDDRPVGSFEDAKILLAELMDELDEP